MKYLCKGAGIRAIALLLCVAMLLPLVGCGKKEETLVAEDAVTAIRQLRKVGEAAGFQNAMSDLKTKHIEQVDGDTYYRFQQYYQHYPVYGRTVVYAADEKGKLTSLSGNPVDVDEDILLEVSPYSLNTVNTAIRNYLTEELGWSNAEDIWIEDVPVSNLCIYNLEGTENSRLAFCLQVGGYELLLDAQEFTVLHAKQVVQNATGYLATDIKREDGFPIQLQDGMYQMRDERRSLSVYDLKGQNSMAGATYDAIQSSDIIFGNEAGEEASEEALLFYRTISGISDYFRTCVGFSCPEIFLSFNDGYDNGSNALGGRYGYGYDGAYIGMISTGTVTGVEDLDVLGHEYGHVISRCIADWTNHSVENCAINEGFSDICGELAEAAVLGHEPDWIFYSENVGILRNIIDPEASGNASTAQSSDGNEGYYYSTVISHAAYLMWFGIDGTETKRIDKDTLMQLWYRALLMMPAGCNFSECRKMLEQAADSMEQLSKNQRACVSEAFDAVGISQEKRPMDMEYDLSNTFVLKVYDLEGQLHSGYTVFIEGVKKEEIQQTVKPPKNQSTVEKWEEEQKNRVTKTVHVDSPEPPALQLDTGEYTFTITDRYNDPVYTFTGYVYRNGSENEVILYTEYEKPLIVEIPGELPLVSDTDCVVLEDPQQAGRIYCYHVPQVNLPGKQAVDLNDRLEEQLGLILVEKVYEPWHEYGFPELEQMAYAWGSTGEAASIIVQTNHTMDGWTDYYIYSFSPTTGAMLSPDALLQTQGLNREQFLELTKQTLQRYWEEARKTLLPKIGQELFTQLMGKTLAQENIQAAVPYINSAGTLSFMVSVYAPAGAGQYLHLFNTEGEADAGYIRCLEEHIPENPEQTQPEETMPIPSENTDPAALQELAGYWQVDTERTMDYNDMSMVAMFGKPYSDRMEIRVDGTFVYYITYSGGKGTIAVASEKITYSITDDYGAQETGELYLQSIDGVQYLVHSVGEYTVFWRRA